MGIKVQVLECMRICKRGRIHPICYPPRLRAACIAIAIAKIIGYLLQATIHKISDRENIAASDIAKATGRSNGTPRSVPVNK